MKTWVNSSLYLKSIRQMEKPSESNLILAFLVVAILDNVLLVEPLQSIRGVQVRVLPLPLFKVEGRLGEVVQGVLLLNLSGSEVKVLILLNLLCLGLLLSLGLGGLGLLGLLILLLLLGCLVSRGSVGESWLAVVEDGSELGVVDDAKGQLCTNTESLNLRLEVSDSVGDLLPQGGVDVTREGVG